MATQLALLERAIALGEEELAHLSSGNVDQACQAAEARIGLLDRLLDAPGGPGADCPDGLVRMRELQERLTGEARKLHGVLKDELVRVRQENRRVSGYAGAARRTPVNVYVNKKG